MKLPSQQRGMSAFSLIIVVLVAVFFGVCAVKLGPLYMQSMTVDSTIQKVVDSGELRGKSVGDIRRKLTKLFDVNRIDALKVKDIKISRDQGYTLIDASYEQRVELMYNIDVVLKFDQLTYEFATAAREG